MKIDLCIWTLNSQRHLQAALESIKRAVPDRMVCHRIAVDGGSRDDTVQLLDQYDWNVYDSSPSIPLQANLALSHVDTELFACFEHDIILPPDWIRILDHFKDQPRLVAVTGRRHYIGSPTLQAIDEYVHNHKTKWEYSLDNTVFRTGILRESGGFPSECPFTSDALLYRRLRSMDYVWLVDTSLHTQHVRDGFPDALKHILIRSLYQKTDVERSNGDKLSLAVYAPIAGARIGGEYHRPWAFPGYSILRFSKAFVIAYRRWRRFWHDAIVEGDMIDEMLEHGHSLNEIRRVLDERRTA